MAANPSSLLHRITNNPGVRSGQPIIRGTRITVWDVLGWLAGGMSTGEIIRDFPELSLEDIQAVHQYALRLKEKVAR
jgi:uncharacterized protein (DUF433 family)